MSDVTSDELLIEDLYLAHGSAIHAAHEGIVTVDESHRIVMMNPAAQRMFGRSAADTLGQDLAVLIPARFQAAHAGHVQGFERSNVHERAMGQRGRIYGLRANGEEFPAAATISRTEMTDVHGTRCLYTALICDLSIEAALRDELEGLRSRFQRLYDLAPVPVWIAEDEQVVFANRACLRLLGVEKSAQVVGRSIYSLLAPSSHAAVREQLSKALAGGSDGSPFTEHLLRPDGVQLDVEIAVAALPGSDHATVQMVITDISAREQERQDLRRLSARVSDAAEEERKRISRELHDELGQRLSAIKMELTTVMSHSTAEQEQRLSETLAMIDSTVASLRRIASGLRPLMLDDLGLAAAIEWLARESASRLGIEVVVDLDEQDLDLERSVSTTLYRMVQEALNNVARHARASDVRISLRRDGDHVRLSVEDNGIGFPPASVRKPQSLGLLGMRERALLLGGSFSIDRPDGGGARVTVRLPLHDGSSAVTPAGAPSGVQA